MAAGSQAEKGNWALLVKIIIRNLKKKKFFNEIIFLQKKNLQSKNFKNLKSKKIIPISPNRLVK